MTRGLSGDPLWVIVKARFFSGVTLEENLEIPAKDRELNSIKAGRG